METSKEIKDAVKEKYGQIARGEVTSCAPDSSCCGGGGDNAVVNMALKYEDADRSAVPDGADLGLGCGTPAAFAELREGMTVVDLGSGGGIDCFIAAQHVGLSGRVIGVDMTEEMIAKANTNKAKVAAPNVEFRLGEIEALPVESITIDRVLSNCVINLVPNKAAAFGEIFRVLKSGGGFMISDIVVNGKISDEERKDASLWAGCISGALDRAEYLGIIEHAGFTDIRVVSEKRYEYKLQNDAGLYSVTVSATKP
jgi:SAM-dependent methyltransferase